MRGLLRRWVFVATVVACAAGVVLVPSVAGGASSASDWYTYGFDLHRSGENPLESTIGVGNASSLHRLWSRSLGGVIVGQPMVAAGIVINGTAHNVVYVGDEHGHFAAIDETKGTVLWEHKLRTVTIGGCTDVAGGVFGIGGAALIDRPANTVFIAAGDGSVHAFDLATGVEQAGWPVHVFNPRQLTSYGGITSDPGFTSLYVEMASHCDFRPYHGGLAKIDVASHSVATVFKPAGRFDGGGIWGPGGASYDPATNHVFVATGNAFTTPESYKYSEHVVELDTNLKVVGADYPGLTGGDVDFGATPIIYQASGCPVQVAAENKSGILVVYTQGHLSAGPTQRLQIANVNAEGFVGIPAYSASLRMLFVANSTDSAGFSRGLIAFTVGTDCQLSKVWSQTIGPQTPTSPPTVANGVVYYGDGVGGTEYAFNASTGVALWNSGTQVAGSIYAAPTVVNGELIVGAWNGVLYAFGP
jgi:outer membrane protein assembly factor BamB